jgi:DedD protein
VRAATEGSLAQDDYYYEIQLTNKQLVFYFLAGAIGLILSFLAGVMVGRGVDQAGEVQAAQPVREDRIVAEETPKPASSPLTQDLSYAKNLEGEKEADPLEAGKAPRTADARAASKPAAPPVKPAVKPVEKPVEKPAASPATAPSPAEKAPVKPSTAPSATPPETLPAVSPSAKGPKPSGPKATGPFTIQVGAFKDKATADSVVGRLKGKGFSAYVISPEGADGLYNVRVGHYSARADAERVQAKLRDDEKFKPFIVKP